MEKRKELIELVREISNTILNVSSSDEINDCFSRLDEINAKLKKIAVDISKDKDSQIYTVLDQFLQSDLSFDFSLQSKNVNEVLKLSPSIDFVKKYFESKPDISETKKNAILSILDNNISDYYRFLLMFNIEQYKKFEKDWNFDSLSSQMANISKIMNLCVQNGVNELEIKEIYNSYFLTDNSKDDVSIHETSSVSSEHSKSYSDPLLMPNEDSNIILDENERMVRQFALDILGYKAINVVSSQPVSAIKYAVADSLDNILRSSIYKMVVANGNTNFQNMLPFFLHLIKEKMKKEGLLKVDIIEAPQIIHSVEDYVYDLLDRARKKDKKFKLSVLKNNDSKDFDAIHTSRTQEAIEAVLGNNQDVVEDEVKVDTSRTQEAIKAVLGNNQDAIENEVKVDTSRTQEAIEAVLGNNQDVVEDEVKVDTSRTQEAIDAVLGNNQDAIENEVKVDTSRTQEAIDAVLQSISENNRISNQEMLGNFVERSFSFRRHISKKIKKKVSPQEHDSIKYKIVNKIISVFGLNDEYQRKR